MALKHIVQRQKRFDADHGWTTDPSADPRTLLATLTRELVGLFGEVGEFANIVKKLSLVADRFGDEKLRRAYLSKRPALSEEIVDVLIYTVRLASILGIDLTLVHQQKLRINAARFKKYMIPKPSAR